MPAGDHVSAPGIFLCAVGGIFLLVGRNFVKRAQSLADVPEVRSLADLREREASGGLPIVAALRGKCASAVPLVSDDGTPGVILKTAITEQLMKRNDEGKWVRADEKIVDVVTEAESWHIEAEAAPPSGIWGGSADPLCVRIDNGKAAEGLRLRVVSTSFDASSPTDVLASAFASLLDGRTDLRSMGVKRTQTMLPLGEAVTAVGEIGIAPGAPDGASSRGGGGFRFVLRRPRTAKAAGGYGFFILSPKSLPQLITDMSAASKVFLVIGAGLGGLGVFLLLRKLLQHYQVQARIRRARRRFFQALRQRRGRERGGNGGGDGGGVGSAGAAVGGAGSAGSAGSAGAAAGAGGAEEPEGGPRASDTCVVCLEQSTACAFPCGHMCVCLGCSRRLDKCPLCQQPGRARRIYRT